MFIYQVFSVGDNYPGFPIFFDRPPGSVPCVVDHILYGDSLDEGDYTAGDPGDPGTLNTNIGILSTTPDTGWRSLEVTDYLLQDLAAGRPYSQYRIRFTIDHDDDLYYDHLGFSSGNVNILDNPPYLLLTFTDSTLSVIPGHGQSPRRWALFPNYPNPFNARTTINFKVARNSKVEMTIFDIRGRAITKLVNDILDAGDYSVSWNGRDDNDRLVPSGIYLYQMKAEVQQGGVHFTPVRKLVILR
jgi:hypothetical protein